MLDILNFRFSPEALGQASVRFAIEEERIKIVRDIEFCLRQSVCPKCSLDITPICSFSDREFWQYKCKCGFEYTIYPKG
jgi:hypothetical protein